MRIFYFSPWLTNRYNIPIILSMRILDKYKDEIVAQFNGRGSCRRLHKKYNVAYITMWTFLKECGCRVNRADLSEEDTQKMIKDFVSGMRYEELGNKYGVGRKVVARLVTKAGFSHHFYPRKHPINHLFFKTLTPESLWVLGWFFSDGNVSRTKNGFSIGVHRNDHSVLERIQSVMGMTGSVHKPRGRNMSVFRGSHPTIHSDLISLGCVPCKSLIIEYPTVFAEDWQHWTFLRGVLEGDGHISFKAKGNRPGFTCHIASGSKRFVDSMVRVLKDRLNIDATIRVKRAERKKIRGRHASFSETYTMRIEKREQILRFLDAIYANCGENRLERKYQVYLKMKEVAARPKDVESINRNRLKEGCFISPDKIVYQVKGIRHFAREMGLSQSRLNYYFSKVPRKRFKDNRWRLATPDEIAAAISTNSLVIKDYGQPVALQPVSLQPIPAQPATSQPTPAQNPSNPVYKQLWV